jgi:EKC/KEOPS complex subunit CGI121/TPRKB
MHSNQSDEMEQVDLAHIPPQMVVYIGYFTDIQNASFLRQQLLAGNAEFEYAFIDASLVYDP